MSNTLDADLPVEQRVLIAYRAARSRADVGGQIYGVLDGIMNAMRSRLAHVERMRADWHFTPVQIEAELAHHPKVKADALAELERWRNMDAKQVPAALLALQPKPPPITPQQFANIKLQDLRRRGLRLSEAHRGEIRVEPGSELTPADRQFVSENKDLLLRTLRDEKDAWSC